MLKTRLTEMFGLDYPIMSAPMALHSGGTLAAAVSKAGGLGSFGGIHPMKGPDWLLGEVAHVRTETERPFGVGFITHLIKVFPAMFDATVGARVPVIAFSFEDPAQYVARAKDSGAKVICQVQYMRHAHEAMAAGADVLVAQGNEAGGHTGAMNLLPFLANILDAYPDIPVLAAGGVSNARTLAAVLAAGADGAWAGTAFLATPECVEVPNTYKDAIVQSDGEDTVYTSVLDQIAVKTFGIPPWPEGIAERMRREPIVDKWLGREQELRDSIDPAAQEVNQSRRPGEQPILMGQGAGQIRAIRPAAEVLHSICDDAERILRERPGDLLA